jgi:hypothetical protein
VHLSASKLFCLAAVTEGGGVLATVTVHDVAIIVTGMATIFSAVASWHTRKRKRRVVRKRHG